MDVNKREIIKLFVNCRQTRGATCIGLWSTPPTDCTLTFNLFTLQTWIFPRFTLTQFGVTLTYYPVAFPSDGECALLLNSLALPLLIQTVYLSSSTAYRSPENPEFDALYFSASRERISVTPRPLWRHHRIFNNLT